MLVVRERIHQVYIFVYFGTFFSENWSSNFPVPFHYKLIIKLHLWHAGHYNIFVGDLSPEVTDATLFACFSVYPSCS